MRVDTSADDGANGGGMANGRADWKEECEMSEQNLKTRTEEAARNLLTLTIEDLRMRMAHTTDLTVIRAAIRMIDLGDMPRYFGGVSARKLLQARLNKLEKGG